MTPAGQVLSLHAHRIMANLLAAETSLAEFNMDSLPVLNFAIIDDLDVSLTPIMATSLQSQYPSSIHKYQMQLLYREHFVLVTARGTYTPSDDWRSVLRDLPLVRYSEAIPMGQLVAAHLKRIGFDAPRQFSFETSRSVIATVTRVGGWRLATPLSILDTSRFRDKIDIHPLPFAKASRQVNLINRMNELGTLPEVLAKQFCGLLQRELRPEFSEIAPSVNDAPDVFTDDVI